MTETCLVDSEGLPIYPDGTPFPVPEWNVACISNGTIMTFYSDIFEYLKMIESL